ncbi:MAG: AEC family transporter, partial [Helicobacter sp.]|nr:AEC family transporter [Helicobacter sp.]
MFVFTPLFTIFILLLGGYVAKLVGALKQRQSRAFLDFTIIFAIPCLIFDGIYHLELSASFIILIFIGFFSCIVSGILATLLGYFLKFSKATLLSIFLLASFGNTLFIGIPIVSGIFSDFLIGKLILYDAFATGIPMLVLSPFIVGLNSTQKINFSQIFKKLVTF